MFLSFVFIVVRITAWKHSVGVRIQRWCPYSDVAEVISSNTDRLDIMDSELFVSRSMSFLRRVLPLD